MKFTFARFSVSLLPPIPRWRYWSSGIVGRIFLKMIFFCCLITFACCDTEEEEMWKMTPVTYLCISAHLKNLTFLSFEFGNRPRKVISFCWRKKNSSAEIPKFHKGQRQGQGQTPLQRRKVVSKSKISLRVLGIQISWIPLNMVNQSQTVHIEKITKTVIHSAL